jgi:hypothetical protein
MKGAVVVKLKGGLGNQMFQYAFARKLAFQKKVPLYFDLRFLLNRDPMPGVVHRNYDLSLFNINAERCPEELLDEYELNLWKTHKKPFRLWPGKRFAMVEEINLDYNPNLNLRAPFLYLDGFWQSYRYFEAIDSIIKEEFTLHENPTGQCLDLLQKIKSENAVMINFRRGDFVHSKWGASFHGTPSLEYYNAAVEQILETNKEVVLYVFSDEPEWCEAHFKPKMPFKVLHHEWAGPKFSFYLELMRACRYFVLSNSTFAWWAAWLSTQPNKKVFAPKPWYANPEAQSQSGNLIPPNWIQIA